MYSGGSLALWRAYLGDDCVVHGVDVEPACRRYASDGVQIHIGDQADEAFWADLLRDVPDLDIVIDDGGHLAHQQIATLNAVLDRLRPGVYICEDLLGEANEFHRYLHGLTLNLHVVDKPVAEGFAATAFQRRVDSVHLYPYLAVIEMRSDALDQLVAPKHGTEWEPFYDSVPAD